MGVQSRSFVFYVSQNVGWNFRPRFLANIYMTESYLFFLVVELQCNTCTEVYAARFCVICLLNVCFEIFLSVIFSSLCNCRHFTSITT